MRRFDAAQAVETACAPESGLAERPHQVIRRASHA